MGASQVSRAVAWLNFAIGIGDALAAGATGVVTVSGTQYAVHRRAFVVGHRFHQDSDLGLHPGLNLQPHPYWGVQ